MDRLLNDEVRKQLQEFFQDMEPVNLIFVMDRDRPTCQYCDYIKQLLEELKEVAGDKINLQIYTPNDKDIMEKYKIDEVPVIVIEGKNKGLIRYFGIPADNEFGMFVETIKEMSLGHVHLPEEVIKEIQEIKRPVRIRVFVTPQCPYCPMAAITAYHMAAINPLFIADVVEATEFQELSNRFKVRAVPTIVINDKVRFEGAYPPEAFLNEIKKALD